MVERVRKYIISKVKRISAPNFDMNPADLFEHFPGMREFNIKRVYWVNNPKKDLESTKHAHKDENGVFLFLKGKAVLVLDDGHGKEMFKMQQNCIVYIPKYVWHEVKDMSRDFVLLVLSDKNYELERRGYIENYEEFKAIIKDK